MIIPFDSVPPVYDMSASVYLESCPPGQAAGCAYVVGASAGAEYAVTGTVLAEDAGTAGSLHRGYSVIAEAMGFVAQLEIGEDERFASGVASDSSQWFVVRRGVSKTFETCQKMRSLIIQLPLNNWQRCLQKWGWFRPKRRERAGPSKHLK